ncbi:mCG54258, partial [Mus musculus]
ARGPQQESSGRLIPTDPGKGPQQLCPAARPARLHPDPTLKEKAWKRKDAGEQRAYGGRGCYLIVCDWGSCGRKDAVVLSSSRSPTPHPPCCQCARTRTRRQLFLSHLSFFSSHLLPIPSLSFHLSFLSSSLPFSHPPSLPSFLPFHPSFFLSFLPSFFPSFLLPSSGERPLSPCSQRTLI